MKTKREIRQAFWQAHPQFQAEYRTRYKQNDYRTDIRVAYTDFVDYLIESGQVSRKLGDNTTL